ncbi:hypothetical protein E2C01_003649 [Portunus trituberculatus]|uniref:Uncharacterized protein n=1 Tax=Portunus trituberculatus TaxID=210409 RepID=A0A5B7CNJ0_PORTR|nr:hypothetical protein [Portunus trituberculatus]
MDVTVWNENELEKLEVGQNRIARMALNAPRYAVIEGLRGDKGWSTFRERHVKAILKFKPRLERMNDARIVRKVLLWDVRNSRWGKKCVRMAVKSSVETSLAFQRAEGRHVESDWSKIVRNGEALEWDVRKWKSEIDKRVKCMELNEWRNEMEHKSSLQWYRGKEAPMYEKWYNCSLGGDILFRAWTQCMNVSARSYRSWYNNETSKSYCIMLQMV